MLIGVHHEGSDESVDKDGEGDGWSGGQRMFYILISIVLWRYIVIYRGWRALDVLPWMEPFQKRNTRGHLYRVLE